MRRTEREGESVESGVGRYDGIGRWELEQEGGIYMKLGSSAKREIEKNMKIRNRK